MYRVVSVEMAVPICVTGRNSGDNVTWRFQGMKLRLGGVVGCFKRRYKAWDQETGPTVFSEWWGINRVFSSEQFSRSVMSNSLRPHESLCKSSLSITNSRSSLKLMSIESVMPSSHLILCRPLLLLPTVPLSIRSFPMSQLFAGGGQSIGLSASASVLQMNTQDWSPLGWTGWISLQSKELSRVFSNTTVQSHQFFSTQLSL